MEAACARDHARKDREVSIFTRCGTQRLSHGDLYLEKRWKIVIWRLYIRVENQKPPAQNRTSIREYVREKCFTILLA